MSGTWEERGFRTMQLAMVGREHEGSHQIGRGERQLDSAYSVTEGATSTVKMDVTAFLGVMITGHQNGSPRQPCSSRPS